jgi:uncharacterized protein with NRDE domain
MCLILIAIHQHPRFPLVVAANRDEYFNRPAAPAHFWPEAPQLLAGRDLQAGGTWLGLTRSGRFAAVTNVREPGRNRADALSRGALTCEFLLGDQPARVYLQDLQARGDHYNGFNLICGDINRLYHYSNRGGDPVLLPTGLHGVSNHLLDTPWPKVTGGKAALAAVLADDDFTLDAVLPVLNQRDPAPDEQLPDTGVGLLMERALSSRFIQAPLVGYGTRVSTALRVDRAGNVEWREWTWNAAAKCVQVAEHDFSLASA